MAATKNRRCIKEERPYLHQFNHHGNITVECVCPKCGINHKMKLIWTGRGKPKKFCQPCKTYASSVEPIDFCSIPASVNAGIE